MGTYSITIYCGYSLDFIIGYFKAFSNAIFNFDFYGISIDFSDDNSKTFDDGCFNSFEDGIAEPRDKYERVSTGTFLYDSTPL